MWQISDVTFQACLFAALVCTKLLIHEVLRTTSTSCFGYDRLLCGKCSGGMSVAKEMGMITLALES